MLLISTIRNLSPILLAGLLFQTAPPAPTPESRKASEMRRSIDALMECDDCKESQEQAVQKLGPAAVPVLATLLREGPSPEKRELVRRHLLQAYQDLKDYEKEHPQAKVPMTEQEYVRTYLENYTARYQVRAAYALARIGGPQARTALDEALRSPLRDDVKVALRNAIEQIGKR
jgi:HEAT repeat protein